MPQRERAGLRSMLWRLSNVSKINLPDYSDVFSYSGYNKGAKAFSVGRCERAPSLRVEMTIP